MMANSFKNPMIIKAKFSSAGRKNLAGKCRFSLLLICFCIAGPVLVSASAAAQSGGAFKLHVAVELTTIEVSILDKDGNPVRNLQKEDFRLYEEGKQQEIYSLDEISAESKASSLGANLMDENSLNYGKTVLIIFDDASIQPQYIKSARDSAEKFIQKHMRPQDVFAVATYGMSLKILQDFTHDPDAVLKAFAQPAASKAGSGPAYFENLLRALGQINPSLARIRGQKSILVYTQPMPPTNSPASEFRSPGFRMDPRAPVPTTSTLDTVYKNALESMRKSNVVVYTIDPGTLASADAGISLSLRSFASESGGFAICDTNNHEGELKKLDQRLSNYYVLSYESNNLKHDGSFRKIEVRTNLKAASLKYREGIQDRIPIDVSESDKMENKLLEALASPEAPTQLPILFRSLYFYDLPQAARVFVAARIRLDKAAFKKKGMQMGADLNFMGVAYREDGSVAARFSETLPVRFDKDNGLSNRQRSMGYQNYLILRPGRYRLKMAVSDESGNMGSTEQFLELPALPEGKLAGSSIVVAEQASPIPRLIQNLQAQLIDADDPLSYSGVQIEPSVANKFPLSAPIPVVFRLYHLPGTADQWDLTAKVKLLDEKGKECVLEPIHLNNSAFSLTREAVAIGLQFRFPKAVAGRYRLIIEAIEAKSGQSALLQTDLEITSVLQGAALN
jgi:VWFA-related protein